MVFTSFRAWSILALLICVAPPANARLSLYWPYERLFRESNLVVIAEAEKSEASKDEFPYQNCPWRSEIEGLVTIFKVKLALKGSESAKEVRVLHFKQRGGDWAVPIVDGPHFVTFATAPVELSTKNRCKMVEKPSYLLFLKRMADGRYEPVTGQFDPLFSVREMFAARLRLTMDGQSIEVNN
jgi:hypothetical protein